MKMYENSNTPANTTNPSPNPKSAPPVSAHPQPATPRGAGAGGCDAGSGGGGGNETTAVLFRRLTEEEHPHVPKRRLLSLLARVRGVVAWRGGLEARRAAVRRRIMALTALVYCHPSQGGAQ